MKFLLLLLVLVPALAFGHGGNGHGGGHGGKGNSDKGCGPGLGSKGSPGTSVGGSPSAGPSLSHGLDSAERTVSPPPTLTLPPPVAALPPPAIIHFAPACPDPRPVVKVAAKPHKHVRKKPRGYCPR